jgi:hypothetical protein
MTKKPIRIDLSRIRATSSYLHRFANDLNWLYGSCAFVARRTGRLVQIVEGTDAIDVNPAGDFFNLRREAK